MRHSQRPPRKLGVDGESLDLLGWCVLVSPLFWVPHMRVGVDSGFKFNRITVTPIFFFEDK